MTSPNPSIRCYVALELGQAKWLVGALLPGRAKVTLHAVRGGDADGLVDVLRKLEKRASAEAGAPVPISICFESGYDGFWLARFLIARGIDTHVLDAASFLVSRRGRRAKTDRIDVEAMALTLKAFLAGDHSVCRPVEVPSPEAEDAKRLSRERTQLTRERTRHVNRASITTSSPCARSAEHRGRCIDRTRSRAGLVRQVRQMRLQSRPGVIGQPEQIAHVFPPCRPHPDPKEIS